MPDESLLTDEVRALVGRSGEPASVTVTPQIVLRAAETFARRRITLPADGEPVPGYVLAGLTTDGDVPALPSLMPNSLLIANEWTFERPLRMGERLTARNRIADVVERFGGQFGYSLHFRTEVEFRDERGELVARSNHTMMQYDAAEMRGGGGGE